MSKTKPYFKNPINTIRTLNKKNQHAKFRGIQSNSFRDMQAFTKLALNKIIYLIFIHMSSRGASANPVNHITMITECLSHNQTSPPH